MECVCIMETYLPAIKSGRFIEWKLISQRNLWCYLRSDLGLVLVHRNDLRIQAISESFEYEQSLSF